MDGNELAQAIDEATVAINRFIVAYDEYQRRRAVDLSSGGLRVVAEQWLAQRAERDS